MKHLNHSLLVASLAFVSAFSFAQEDAQNNGLQRKKSEGLPPASSPANRPPQPQRERPAQKNQGQSGHNNYVRGSKPMPIQVIPRNPRPGMPPVAGNQNTRPRPPVSNLLPLNVVYRSGYYGRDRRWDDSRFRFNAYQFNFVNQQSAFSPWYYNSSLPPYVDTTRVSFNIGNFNYKFEKRVRYQQVESTVDGELRNSVSDLVEGIERNDPRALSRIIPSGYMVTIGAPAGSSYAIESEDFYNMMVDMAANTRTRSYDVLDIETGRGNARVYARHITLDAWGKVDIIFNRVTFEAFENSYRIVEFETSRTSY